MKKMLPKIFNSRVLEIKDVTPSVKHLKLSVSSGIEFKAGQYFSMSVLKNGKKFRKPFSVINIPSNNDKIEFLIKLIPNGIASEFIRNLKTGDEVELFGPVGRFVIGEDFNGDVIFIASGVGIAPFISIIQNLLERGFSKKIILIKSARNEEKILYDKLFNKLAKKHNNFRFYNVLSQPKNKNFENIGYVQNFLEKYVPKNFNGIFYICGLTKMVVSIKDKLRDLGINENRIRFEEFD